MKWVTFISAFALLCLDVQQSAACAGEEAARHACCSLATGSGVDEQAHCPGEPAGEGQAPCNESCSCACCGHLIAFKATVALALEYSENPVLIIRYPSSPLSGFLDVIWQPPRRDC